VGSRAGDGSGSPPGVKPGALTDLLRQVAGSPEERQAEAPPLLPGAVIGRFEIQRELGRGAFGVVYEARDRDLGRQVALKMVRPGAAAVEDGKISREAEAIARLAHPNLVTLHDVGSSEHGPYLVFELLRGKTLQERIDDGPMPVQEAVNVAVEVARGLAHAHAEGVVHRDLKPANVFVTSKGQVKILDFGMAHAFGRRRLSGGTPAYMAPEQWEDDPEDERTDVFALGVMLHRMLSGEYPFPEGEGRWSAGPTRAPKLDVPGAPGLADLVDRMLEKTPKGRPRDGAAVLAALTPIEEALRAKPADGSPPAHATRRKATLGDLIAELKRRRVFRVMVGYGIFAFAALQVTEPIMHGAHLPEWVLTAVLVALAVGFPVALTLAWLFDLTAQGVRRTPSVIASTVVPFSRTRVALLLVGVALVAALPGAAWYLWRQSVERGPGTATPATPPSIAVLPFSDLSPGKDQEYLSDGIAEEILNALSRVEGLRVAGRTSSFYFKGKGARLADIGKELNVGAVLEGGVRREGNRIRVTATVVKVADGFHVWSESWDRELKDILATEHEIARHVVDAMKVTLLGGARPVVPEPPWTTAEAHLHVLKGRQAFNRGSYADYEAAVSEYQKALKLDPSLSSAWAGLAMALDYVAENRTNLEALLAEKRRALEAAERAVVTGPENGEAYVIRATFRSLQRHEWTEARQDLERAFSIGEEGVNALLLRGRFEAASGRLAEALQIAKRAVVLEPLSAHAEMRVGFYANGLGDHLQARRAFERVLEIAPDHSAASGFLAQTLVLMGKPKEALAAAARSRGHEAWRVQAVALAEHALGDEAASRKALEDLIARYSHNMPFQIAEVCAFRKEADCAFHWLDRADERRDLGMAFLTYSPFLAGIRRDLRYQAFLRKVNLPIGAGSTEARTPETTAVAPTPTIAVLPFADMSERHDQDYLSEGIAEEILNALARVDGLRVVGRTSSWYFKGKNARLADIGRELRVASVLEGSVRREGSRLRVSAKLLAVPDGRSLWAETYDRDLGDVFALQEGIARAVVGALRVRLLPGPPAVADQPRTTPETYQQVLIGRQILERLGPGSGVRAVEAFERAMALDPAYAPAWAGLASARYWQSQAGGDETMRLLEHGRAAADRAIALGPGLSAGYEARAQFRLAAWDWEGARSDAERAVAIDPGSAVARRRRALVLRIVSGDAAQGFDDLDVAMALDPLSAAGWHQVGLRRSILRQLDRAREAYLRALQITPDFRGAASGLAVVEMQGGRFSEARRLVTPPDGSLPAFWKAALEHAAGDEKASSEGLADLARKDGAADPISVAEVHAWRGERDLAFQWLEKALVRRDPSLRYARDSFFLESLHPDPRWKALLRKMNLPVD
jgi:TolB-like protein/Tfp pilus assembly protein PilF